VNRALKWLFNTEWRKLGIAKTLAVGKGFVPTLSAHNGNCITRDRPACTSQKYHATCVLELHTTAEYYEMLELSLC
jgi:hypothetical protein